MFTAGVTVEVWRPAQVSTPRGTRDQFALHHTEDGWAFAPPTPIDQAEPAMSARDEVDDALVGYREDLPTQIAAADEVVIPGQGDLTRFKVMGRPGPWSDPWSGVFCGSTMRVRRISG